MQDQRITFLEKEKEHLVRDVSNLIERIEQDIENKRPIDWLFNFEKHRVLSSKVIEAIEDKIKKQIESEKQSPKTEEINGLSIALSTSFINDIDRMNFYIEGEQKPLGDGTKEGVILGFLKFLGYEKYANPNNPTQTEINRNQAAINILKEISFVCNQSIGNATIDTPFSLRTEEGYPLKLDDGTEFAIFGLASKIILVRTKDDKINLKYELIPEKKPEFVLPLEGGYRTLVKEGKNDFYVEANISLTSEGALERVKNASLDYTAVT